MLDPKRLTQRLVTPQPERLNYIRYAFRRGLTRARGGAHDFDGSLVPLFHIKEITDTIGLRSVSRLRRMCHRRLLRKAKRMGVSDERIAEVWSLPGATGVEQVPTAAPFARHQAGLQAGGHLRGGV